jgi:hypothetical protein
MPRDANDVMREHGLNALREGLDGALASEGLRRINETERTDEIDKKPKPAVSLDDFRAYMVVHKYIFTDTGDLWPASSVNARIPPVPISSDIEISASKWLDTRQPVEQVTWAPGRPQIIEGQVIAEGGWIDRPGCSVYNFYRPPVIRLGDATKAGQWIDHVRRVYGNEADHIFSWLAHRVQCPGEKLTMRSCWADYKASAGIRCWSRSNARSGPGTGQRFHLPSCSGGSMASQSP